MKAEITMFKFCLVLLVISLSTGIFVASHKVSIGNRDAPLQLSDSSFCRPVCTINPNYFRRDYSEGLKGKLVQHKNTEGTISEPFLKSSLKRLNMQDTLSSRQKRPLRKHRLLSMVSNQSNLGNDKELTKEEKKKAQEAVFAKQKQFYSLFAGGFAGAVSSTITCPIEVVKTQLQSSSTLFANAKGSPFKIASQILQKEGITGFFRGLPPTLVGIIPSRATYFWAYSSTKNFFVPLIGDKAPTHILAGIAAGVTSNTITNPIWMVKTRMQILADATTGQKAYNGYVDAIRTIYQQEGLKGFMKGISASYWGCSEGCIQFVSYEKLKKKLIKQNNQKRDEKGLPPSDELTPVQTLSCAAASKFIATSLTYPHEVVRTRLREQARNGTFKYKTMWQSLRLIAKEEGRQGLYAGMGTHIARVVPNTAIMFLSYELINSALNRREEKLKAALDQIDEDMSTGFDEEEE